MSQPQQSPGAAQAGPLSSPDPWNLVAEGYEAVAREFLERFSRSGLAKLDYNAETRVLDVACGPGTTTLLLSPHVARITCVDFSAKMLDTLRRKSAAAGAQNLEILQADGQALPFDDGSFDLAVSMFGLMFFPDREKGFAELHRVLVPGGQALVSSWAPLDQSPLMGVVLGALQPDDVPPEPPRLSGLDDPAVFEAEMRGAGFADIHIEAVIHGQQVDDVEVFWRDMARGMVPITMLKHQSSAEDWSKIERRALDRLMHGLGDKLPVTLSSTAYLATARKGRGASNIRIGRQNRSP